MDGLGRFAALTLAVIILAVLPVSKSAELKENMLKEQAEEYLFEINSLVNRRGTFTKEEFERYSYILYLLRQAGELELESGSTEIGGKKE